MISMIAISALFYEVWISKNLTEWICRLENDVTTLRAKVKKLEEINK